MCGRSSLWYFPVWDLQSVLASEGDSTILPWILSMNIPGSSMILVHSFLIDLTLIVISLLLSMTHYPDRPLAYASRACRVWHQRRVTTCPIRLEMKSCVRRASLKSADQHWLGPRSSNRLAALNSTSPPLLSKLQLVKRAPSSSPLLLKGAEPHRHPYNILTSKINSFA